ncbi:MAG: TolC family protein [Chlorobi bacterium]|nr:TolC family protein [Chlorobiota bacterium]
MLSKLLLLSGIFLSIITPYASAQDSSAVNQFYEEFTGQTNVDSLDFEVQETSGVLSLNDAIIIGLKNNPRLKSKHLEINAYQAAALQAGLYPNPGVGVDLENFLGSGDYGAFGASENTFFITQDFILGGRLSKAEKLELLNSNLAKWELEKERLSLITEIRKSFTVILSLDRQNKLNKKLLKISRDFITDLERRIKAGKVSPAEASRASLISTSLEIKIQSAEMRLASETANLKALLGVTDLDFSSLENICNLQYDVPEFGELKNLILESPSLAQFKTEMKRVKTAVELEEAKVVPDLSLSLGYRRINETSDNVIVFGASIPIPIFDDNRGNIQRAKIREDQTKYNLTGAITLTEARLRTLYNNVKALDVMIEKLGTESLPKAKDALKIINEGNLVGRFTVLDVLDAQRNLFELESQFVNAVAEYNRNVIDLEELTLTKFNFKYKARINEDE